MTPRDAGIVGLPALVVAVLGWVAEAGGAVGQGVASTAAATLAGTAAIGTTWISRRLTRRHPSGAILGMILGAVLRGLIVVGGGSAVYFLTPVEAVAGVGFWVWLSVAYLSSLVVETAVLIRSAGGAGPAKG